MLFRSSLNTYAALPDEGKTVALHIHTHVREEAIQLFGFASVHERDVFELLLRASRVGPKLAQTVLSGMEPAALLAAIRDGDLQSLCRIPGVGRKLAERVVVELRERADELARAVDVGVGHGPALARAADADEEAVSALVNLGYPSARAERVITLARDEVGADAATEVLIRAALRGLAGQGKP